MGNTGCLQIQQNEFPANFQEIFYKIPVDFLTMLWSAVNQEVNVPTRTVLTGAREDELRPTLITTNQK